MVGKCFNCGSGKIVETSLALAGGLRARAWKCRECGETILDSSDAQKALLYNKLRRGVKVTVGQLGKSLVMRFPAAATALLGLKKGSKVEVRTESTRKLVVTT